MVRVFKGLENKKTYYAVTGTIDPYKATLEVVRHKKMAYSNIDTLHWDWAYGTIAPYKNGMDGLWLLADFAKGQPCVIITTRRGIV